MPKITYTAASRELHIRLPENQSEAYFAELGTLLTQFVDRKLRTLGNRITAAIEEEDAGKPPKVKRGCDAEGKVSR
jgi:hypothetical protein